MGLMNFLFGNGPDEYVKPENKLKTIKDVQDKTDSVELLQLVTQFESLATLLESKNPNKEYQNSVMKQTIKEYDFDISSDGHVYRCEINCITNSRGLAKWELLLDLNGDGIVDEYLISDHGDRLAFEQMKLIPGEQLPDFVIVDTDHATTLLNRVQDFITTGAEVSDTHLTGLM